MGKNTMTSAEYQEYLRLKKMGIKSPQILDEPSGKKHKFNARKTLDKRGVECPSWLHAVVSNFHIDLEDAGKIENYRREVPIELKEKCNYCGTSAMVYKVDFVYEVVEPIRDYKKGETVYVEPKGAKDKSFLRRERRWRKVGPGRLELWAGNYRSGACIPYLKETIKPK